MAANEVRFAVEAPPVMKSEYECDLMIEALSRELTAIKDHLAFLTHRLYTEENQGKVPTQQATPPPPNRSPLVSPQQKHTKKKRLLQAARDRRKSSQAEYLSLVDRTEGARADARKQCLALMQRHIQDQLATLKKRSGELRRRMAKREHRIRLAKIKLKPPRHRSSGVDDTSFLGNVYLSSFYKIVDEEHRLRKAGQLQSLNDLKTFWEDMLSPLIPHTPTPTPGPTTHMCDDDDSDDEGYTNSWALTALPPDSRDKLPVRTSALYNDQELEFVPSVLPKLRSIADILDEGKQLKKEAPHHTHPHTGVESVGHCVHQMYQQSRANEMAMRRLLPSSPTFDLPPLSSSTHSPDTPPPQSTTPPPQSTTPPPQSTTLLRHSTTLSIPPPSVNKATASIQSSPPQPLLAPLILPPQPLLAPLILPPQPLLAPLTMDSALGEGRILEPKCKSSLWTNFITAQI